MNEKELEKLVELLGRTIGILFDSIDEGDLKLINYRISPIKDQMNELSISPNIADAYEKGFSNEYKD